MRYEKEDRRFCVAFAPADRYGSVLEVELTLRSRPLRSNKKSMRRLRALAAFDPAPGSLFEVPLRRRRRRHPRRHLGTRRRG